MSCDKHVYQTKKDAMTTMNRLRNGVFKNGTRRKVKNPPKRMYYCYSCKGWHLTSRDDRENR